MIIQLSKKLIKLYFLKKVINILLKIIIEKKKKKKRKIKMEKKN